MEEKGWEVINNAHNSKTLRLSVDGGYIYRVDIYAKFPNEINVREVASSMCFVPRVKKEVPSSGGGRLVSKDEVSF